jgi:ribosomal-protein-serine acetyltransferase
MPPDIPNSTTLADDRLLLRAMRENDSSALFAAIDESKEQLGRWMPWYTSDYARSDTEVYVRTQLQTWKESVAFSFLIEDRRTGNLLGSCGLNRLDWLTLFGNLGYWVRTSASRTGVATAATRLLLDFAFEWLGLFRVEIVAAVGNLASQRVAEKVGAVREGCARNRCRGAGVQHDAYVYSVIPEDVRVKPE